MLEQVELKIQELRKMQIEEYYKKKEEDLAAWGLASKKDGKKTIPIIVTDEEYEALIKASNGVGPSGRNSLAITFNVVSALVMLLGVVGGFIVSYLTTNLGFVYFTLAVIISALVALVFRGLAEAIRLLQQIVDGRPAPITYEQKVAYEAEKAANAKPAKGKKKAASAEAPVNPAAYQSLYNLQPGQQNVPVAQPPVYMPQPAYAVQQPAYVPQSPYPQQPGAYVPQPAYPQQPYAQPAFEQPAFEQPAFEQPDYTKPYQPTYPQDTEPLGDL